MKKLYLIAGAYGLAGAALAGKLLSRPRDAEWEKHKDRVPHSEHSRFAEVKGVPVHYQSLGDESAPTLILIHGFCASTFVWSDVFLSLAAAGFRVVVPDLIGFGFSAKPRRAAYTIEAQARMIVGLMNELKIKRAKLVGSSYGGAIAAACALDEAERVERLVLVGAVANDAVKNQTLLRLAASPVMGDLLSPVLIDSRRLMRWRMKEVYAATSPHAADEARMQAHHLPLRAANTQRAVLRTLRQWSAARIEANAHRITQPTLLIWGESDRDVPLTEGLRLHARMPNARLIVFRHCGHLPQEEYPREFSELVTKFCREELAAIPGQQILERKTAKLSARV